jgi:hypothetical protein
MKGTGNWHLPASMLGKISVVKKMQVLSVFHDSLLKEKFYQIIGIEK